MPFVTIIRHGNATFKLVFVFLLVCLFVLDFNEEMHTANELSDIRFPAVVETDAWNRPPSWHIDIPRDALATAESTHAQGCMLLHVSRVTILYH